MVFVGKILMGAKGDTMLDVLHWNFDNRQLGDVFYSLPRGLSTTFQGLVQLVRTRGTWKELCEERRPKKWVRFDEDGNPNTRRSSRTASRRGNERAAK